MKKNSGFGAKTSRYSSKFKFFNSIFEFQALKLLFALLTSNITYMKRLRSVATEEASTDEKTVKNSAGLAPKLDVTAQKSNC